MHLFRLNDSAAYACQLNQTDYADNVRLVLVGLIGSGIASTSIFENLALFYVFATSKKLRRQNYANPVLLAFFDIVVSVCYMLIACVNVIAYRFEYAPLALAWAKYMRVIYCLQHFALTVSNFLLVIASIERYLANGPIFTKKRLLVLLVHNKVLVVSMIFVLSFLFKATLYFENATIALDHCQVIESLVPVWVTDGTTEQSVRFWLRKCFTMIVPFMILAFCNTHIVWHLRSRRRRADAEKAQQAAGGGKRKSIKATRSGSFKRRYSEKRGVRVATRTLVMVVGCYLISNTTTTIINIWEYFDVHFLRYEHYYSYLIASDIAALLTILGCALRLPIYVINDRRIRKAIFRALIRWRYYRTEELNEAEARNLEKWSIIIVSNSLRSNLTGMLSQVGDLTHFKGKKSFDQLAVVVQNRRRFLVQMTINLGQVCELPPGDDSPMGHDVTYLTDIHEEDEDAELLDQERTTIKKLTNYSAVLRPSTSAVGWKSWKANI